MLLPVVKQNWVWSKNGKILDRPGDFTLHLNKTDRDSYVRKIFLEQSVTCCITIRALDGEPTVIDVPEEAHETIKQRNGCVWLNNESEIKDLIPTKKYLITAKKQILDLEETVYAKTIDEAISIALRLFTENMLKDFYLYFSIQEVNGR
jgi:hypothetical protein